jgi:hypothetical protein
VKPAGSLGVAKARTRAVPWRSCARNPSRRSSRPRTSPARSTGTGSWGSRFAGVYPDTDEPTWCEVSRDGVILQFLGGETPWPGPPAFTGTFYFHPENVEGLYEQIKDHIPPAWGNVVRDWGARELGLQDPNGYFLTFTEPA